MMLLTYALVIAALVGWNMWPAALLSYITGDEEQLAENPIGELPTVTSESETGELTQLSANEGSSEVPASSPGPTPTVAGSTIEQAVSTTVNGAEITPSPSPLDDCDFEYHLDTSEEDSSGDDVHIEHRCTQTTSEGSIDNNVDIDVSTGGNSSNGNENAGTQTSGDVKIDLSVRNEAN